MNYLDSEWRLELWSRIQPKLLRKQFWQASGLLLLANIILVVLGLIRTPLITWAIPKDEVGMLGVVSSWIPYLSLFSLPGLDSAAHHYVSKGKTWAYLANLNIRLRWSLITSLGMFIGAAYWIWKKEIILGWLFIISGITFPFTSGLSAAPGMFGAQEKFTNLFWYRIIEGLIRFSGFLPLILSTWFISKVVTFYSVNQIVLGIFLIIVSLFLIKQFRAISTRNTPMKERQEMVVYGKHLTTINGIGVLQNRTDALLVGILFPLTTMANYSIALIIQGLLKRLWTVYVTVRYPPLVRMSVERRHRRFIVEGGLVVIAFIVIGIFGALLAYLLVPIVLPPDYRSSLPYIYMFIAATIVGIPGGLSELYFRTNQDEKRQYILRILAAISGVLSPILFITLWGAYGAAAGRIVGNLFLSIAGVVLFFQKSP